MPSYIVFFPHYVLIASYKPKRLRRSSAYALIARLFQACIYVHFYLLMRSGLRTPFKCYLYYICLCHSYKFFKSWLIKKSAINQLAFVYVIYITFSKYDKKCAINTLKTLLQHILQTIFSKMTLKCFKWRFAAILFEFT